MAGKNPGNTAKKEESSDDDDTLVIQQLQALSNVVNNGPLLLLVESDDNSPPVTTLASSTQTISSNQSNTRSVVHEDKEAGPVVNAFEQAIKLFDNDPEMSFKEFEGMFIKLGIGGDLHADDDENKDLKEYSAARASFILQVKAAIQLLNEPRKGMSALIRDKLMRAAFLANGCLAARSRALSDAISEIERVCHEGAKHKPVKRKHLPLVQMIGECLKLKCSALLECQTLAELVRYKDLVVWAEAALHAAAVYEAMVSLPELDCTIDFTFQPFCNLAEKAFDAGPSNMAAFIDELIKLGAHWNAVWCVACPMLDSLPSMKKLCPSSFFEVIELLSKRCDELIEIERSKKKKKGSSSSNDDDGLGLDVFAEPPASDKDLLALVPASAEKLPDPCTIDDAGETFVVTYYAEGGIVRITFASKTGGGKAATAFAPNEPAERQLERMRKAIALARKA